ncbi:MAG: cytochrome c peroxidase [Pseudomonadota bacterium]
MAKPGIRVSLFLLWGLFAHPAIAVDFSESEIALITAHGPWPPATEMDKSNRVSGNPLAIKLGERLFFDHDLGRDSKLSCASCHDPGLLFSDGKSTAEGRNPMQRNTPTLQNIAFNRWFGWGGESDSLWAQTIRPIVSVDEMAATPESVKRLLQSKAPYRELYHQAFDRPVDEVPAPELLVDVAKALAAYQETFFSAPGEFDQFREALLKGDSVTAAGYPESAQRGLKLFIGEGRCNLCHFGPRFSNGEFANIGVNFFVEGGVDSGRYQGIQQLKSSPYNRLGARNDGDADSNGLSTRQVHLKPRNWGEFKIPGLRGVSMTAPYMHNGSLKTLRDVVKHYSEIDEERLHTDGENILRPLHWNDQQIDDLVRFLETLGFE